MTGPCRNVRLREQRGFTLVEVMAALLVLLGGVLGTVTMIDGANATTSTTKSREGATNLAREVLETTRAADYDKVSSSELPGQLQGKPDLADESGESGWQVRRRGIEYSIAVEACIFDDPTDSAGNHEGGEFCPNSAAPPSAPPDSNPDDYRRVRVDASWERRGRRMSVSQTAMIVNPSGGLGPRITSFEGPDLIESSVTTQVAFTVRTTTAKTVQWAADDGASQATASGGPTAWSFSWDLKPVGTFSCDSPPGWVLDGQYVVTAQAFDSRGIPGDLRARTVQVDRQAPAPPCGLAGGRNGPIVDLQWLRNPERDIAGYRVFRKPVAGESGDVEVCPLSSETTCYDPNPPDPATHPKLEYYVQAEDADPPETKSQSLVVDQGPNTRPDPPASLQVALVEGLPTLSWTAATDPDGTIQFYRVYRDGTALDDRYGATSGAELSFTDKTDELGHSYWVTAVDDKFRESLPVGPVTP